jgi:arylsulfatase A-like enzyme
MPADIVTLPRLLHQAGYVTGVFGKWGLGAPGSPSDPAEHFDLFFGYNCQREAHTYYPLHLWKNEEKIALDGKTHSAAVIMSQALDFIRRNQDRPFFVYLPVTIPHAAMHATEEYAAPFRDKFPQFADKIGRYARTEVKNPIAAFAGMMTQLDDQVGEVMGLLRELGLEERTLVMLSSDNGPHREGGHDPEFFDSNGPLRGHKRDLYEGGIRVPLIARWLGHVPTGTESDLISAHWDMLPTICELAEAETPEDIDGISIVNELLGRSAQQAQHEYLYWEFYERGGKRAVRYGDWKAVQLNVNQDLDAPVEIYNLSVDLGEEHNIADDLPEKVARAKTIFAEAHTPSEFLSFGR